jgi:hypothetical protein
MRTLLALAAAIGLAAAPCAWDDDPREAPSILALLSRPRPLLSSVAPFPYLPAEVSAAVTTPQP